MEEFYEKHIPKSSLPSDYGGDLDSIQEHHQQNWRSLEGLQDFFDKEEQIRKKI